MNNNYNEFLMIWSLIMCTVYVITATANKKKRGHKMKFFKNDVIGEYIKNYRHNNEQHSDLLELFHYRFIKKINDEYTNYFTKNNMIKDMSNFYDEYVMTDNIKNEIIKSFSESMTQAEIDEVNKKLKKLIISNSDPKKFQYKKMDTHFTLISETFDFQAESIEIKLTYQVILKFSVVNRKVPEIEIKLIGMKKYIFDGITKDKLKRKFVRYNEISRYQNKKLYDYYTNNIKNLTEKDLKFLNIMNKNLPQQRYSIFYSPVSEESKTEDCKKLDEIAIKLFGEPMQWYYSFGKIYENDKVIWDFELFY